MTQLPAHTYLDQHNIPYERKSFSPETEKGAANVAHALGFSERQAVKTLIFQVVDTCDCVLVMLGAEIMITPENLVKASNAIVVNLTEKLPQ
jgi:Cys-tRNA(Pro)/Cys-tRNA(Cys) deacylase